MSAIHSYFDVFRRLKLLLNYYISYLSTQDLLLFCPSWKMYRTNIYNANEFTSIDWYIYNYGLFTKWICCDIHWFVNDWLRLYSLIPEYWYYMYCRNCSNIISMIKIKYLYMSKFKLVLNILSLLSIFIHFESCSPVGCPRMYVLYDM